MSFDCMDDLREADVDVLTLWAISAAYVEPPVERFVTPDEFERYREWAGKGLQRSGIRRVCAIELS